MLTTTQVLEKARQIVLDGWHQGSHTNGDGAYCLRTAIGIASGAYIDRSGEVCFNTSPKDLPEDRWRHVQALEADLDATQRVVQSLPSAFVSIPVFNDDPQTCKDEVLAVMDKAVSA